MMKRIVLLAAMLAMMALLAAPALAAPGVKSNKAPNMLGRSVPSRD
jgi:hypothetical protein